MLWTCKNVAAHNVLATEILTKKKLEAAEIKIQAEALEKVTPEPLEVKKALPQGIPILLNRFFYPSFVQQEL